MSMGAPEPCTEDRSRDFTKSRFTRGPYTDVPPKGLPVGPVVREASCLSKSDWQDHARPDRLVFESNVCVVCQLIRYLAESGRMVTPSRFATTSRKRSRYR